MWDDGEVLKAKIERMEPTSGSTGIISVGELCSISDCVDNRMITHLYDGTKSMIRFDE